MVLIGHRIKSNLPNLKKKLDMAHMNVKPEKYIDMNFQLAIIAAIGFGVMLFLIFLRYNKPLIFIPLLIIGIFLLFFWAFMKRADAKIMKRKKDIDKEVLFAGRFLLVKLNSGRPLMNSLVDASKSYGVASKYFKEIVHDIELGKPIEEALEKASIYSPSRNFRKILFQISNALKIGIDVSKFLEATLEHISHEQLIEIQRYGKKLNSVTMFYMLFAVVLPSLGMTLLVVIGSFLNIQMDINLFVVVLFFLIILEFMFITVFKSIRPNVNI